VACGFEVHLQHECVGKMGWKWKCDGDRLVSIRIDGGPLTHSPEGIFLGKLGSAGTCQRITKSKTPRIRECRLWSAGTESVVAADDSSGARTARDVFVLHLPCTTLPARPLSSGNTDTLPKTVTNHYRFG